jgi:hypothetical protein
MFPRPKIVEQLLFHRAAYPARQLHRHKLQPAAFWHKYCKQGGQLMKELHESFTRMIDTILAKGVYGATELEHLLVEEGLAHKRRLSLQDTISILNFFRYLRSVKLGLIVSPGTLPMNHMPFYRITVERLIEAGQLPYRAKEQFETAFSDAWSDGKSFFPLKPVSIQRTNLKLAC